MTTETKALADHEFIYLQPVCCADDSTGRLWCQDPDPEDCDDGKVWTKYVRYDKHLALLEENKRLREALALVSNQIARFVSGPGNCIDPAFYFKNVNGYITEALANHAQESDENKTADWRNDVDSYEPSATPKPEGE